MEQIESINLFLKWGFFILLALSFISLKKGRQPSRRYKYQSKKQKKNFSAPSTNKFQFSEQSIFDAALTYSKKPNHYLAFDTDVLLEHPYITTVISNKINIPILISQQVRYELDKIKDGTSELKQKARVALKNIGNLHRENKVEIIPVDKDFIRKHNLRTDVKDDLIIGSYLQRLEEKSTILFITNDNNARTTARTTLLIPLELNWEEKTKKVKNVAFRPGYSYKVISLALFSLAFGFLYGLKYMEERVQASVTSNITVENVNEVTFKENQPTYINSEYPYVIKNEYNEFLYGAKTGEWGALAVVDTNYHKASGLFPSTFTVVLGSWISKEPDEKENKLKYVIVKQNGQEIEQSYLTIFRYSEDTGITIESLDTNVKYEGVNSYEKIGFNLSKDEDENSLKGASLKLIHKVTNEVIQTIPLTTMKKES